MRTVVVELELADEELAGLKRFAEKVTHEQAMSVLYPHVKREVRDDQAYAIVHAFAKLDEALSNVRSWPWIETGKVES